MKTPTSLACGMVILLATCAAEAYPGEGTALQRLDQDADQRLSREEAALSARLAQQFPLIDRNADGFLDQDELRAYAEQRRALEAEARALRFARLDADGNGVIDASELGSRALARLDANGDGVVDREEFTARSERRAEHRGAPRGKRHLR